MLYFSFKKRSCSAFIFRSVMGPTGAGKSTVRVLSLSHVQYHDDPLRSSSNVLPVKTTEPLVVGCGLLQKIFESSEPFIPTTVVQFSSPTPLASMTHPSQMWRS